MEARALAPLPIFGGFTCHTPSLTPHKRDEHKKREGKELIFPRQFGGLSEGRKRRREILCANGLPLFSSSSPPPRRERKREREAVEKQFSSGGQYGEKREGMQRRDFWAGGRGRYKLGQFQACVMTPLFSPFLLSREINNLGGEREASRMVHPGWNSGGPLPPFLPCLNLWVQKTLIGWCGREECSPPLPPSAKSPNCRVFERAPLLPISLLPPPARISAKRNLFPPSPFSSWHYHWGVLPMVFFLRQP